MKVNVIEPQDLGQMSYINELNGRIFWMVGGGWNGSVQRKLIIYEIDENGNIKSKIYESSDSFGDSYMTNVLPEYNALLLHGVLDYSSSKSFIRAVRTDGTELFTVSINNRYIVQLLRFKDKYLIIPCCGNNYIYVAKYNELNDPTKYDKVELPGSTYSDQEIRGTVFANKVYLIKISKHGSGILIEYDPDSGSMEQLYEWTSSPSVSNLVFDWIHSNKDMLVLCHSYETNKYKCVWGTDPSAWENNIVIDFNGSGSGEYQCGGIPVNNENIIIFNTLDSNNAKIVVIDRSGNILLTLNGPLGHLGHLSRLIKGRLFVNWEMAAYVDSKSRLVIIEPDIIKTLDNVVNKKCYAAWSGTGVGVEVQNTFPCMMVGW